MNRLIIIGNGFDLAHRIKTSFNDFITDYFCNVMREVAKGKNYSDPLIQIKVNMQNYWRLNDPIKTPVNRANIFILIEEIRKSEDYEFIFLSPLLERVYSECSTLFWVDIEMEYFNLLLDSRHREKGVNQRGLVKKLNSELEFLKEKLIEYLEQEQLQFGGARDSDSILDCFCSDIKKHEIVTAELVENLKPDKLYFLNFNYTNTFERYAERCREKIPSEWNYIHGDLYKSNGKPIFGFGDELDKNYLEFEDDRNNELFKHIKSFEYLQTKNFYLLTRFIESCDFQVHIYGHSCGLSDRTMLNQIFEHENCKSIKIYYFKESDSRNDFVDKCYEISRHFKDKTMLRKKLIPFTFSEPMPQPGNINENR
ncbi:abortive infection AbiH-like protein [Algoriphagus ratkowskyi]|uniref:Abortive infection AbiH-like protein n=1 Tax=Algoriphagus ratkowskyi TaxID=57028 RepID=A0A2W7R4B5_9BACT|nr:AbiH family protein [Algoriphagus ratkowskyi]PZX55334.1 abortive infection AbiH-like protein [Algoriphagus ratkowskyi]TXD79735.1 hypothetical protein ESW18_00975 [Algoriphagus ratkowskyi]